MCDSKDILPDLNGYYKLRLKTRDADKIKFLTVIIVTYIQIIWALHIICDIVMFTCDVLYEIN